MTPEQIEELRAQAPELNPEYRAVAHVYMAFLDGAQALGHAISHTQEDDSLLPALREAGKALLEQIKEPMSVFQIALEDAADATASPEVKEFAAKLNAATTPQVTLAEGGVLDFSNKNISGMTH